MIDDCCLHVFSLTWCAGMSVFGMSCIVCECGDDNNVIAFECCQFDCVECLREGECHVCFYVVMCVVFVDAVDIVFKFVGSEVFEIAVMKDEGCWLRGGRRRSSSGTS